MDVPYNSKMKQNEILRLELEVLRDEHRDLDEAIIALHEKPTFGARP